MLIYWSRGQVEVKYVGLIVGGMGNISRGGQVRGQVRRFNSGGVGKLKS